MNTPHHLYYLGAIFAQAYGRGRYNTLVYQAGPDSGLTVGGITILPNVGSIGGYDWLIMIICAISISVAIYIVMHRRGKRQKTS